MDFLSLSRVGVVIETSIHHSIDRHIGDLERFLAQLDARNLQHVENQLMQPLGLLFDPIDELQVVLGVAHRTQSKRLRIRFDRRQWRF